MLPPASPEVESEAGARISSGSSGFCELVKARRGGVLSTATVRLWQLRLPAKSTAQIDTGSWPSRKGGAAVFRGEVEVEIAPGHGSNVFAYGDPGTTAQPALRVSRGSPSTVATIRARPDPASLAPVVRFWVPLRQPAVRSEPLALPGTGRLPAIAAIARRAALAGGHPRRLPLLRVRHPQLRGVTSGPAKLGREVNPDARQRRRARRPARLACGAARGPCDVV